MNSKKEKKPRRWLGLRPKTWIKFLFFFAVIFSVSLAYYSKTADRLIASKFDQESKWNIPSRIYTDAEYIYSGYNIDERRLLQKLDRLSYRRVEKAKDPGDYAVTESFIDIYLHDFRYPDEDFKGFLIRLKLSGNTVREIIKDKAAFEIARLEPEELAPILDPSMEKRTLVKLKEVPKQLIDSIVLIEDERFYKHHGIDPRGIIRAFFVNISHGRIVQGGSTLTQQLVKNFFLHPRKSIWRKINEMFLAWRIEQTHTKDEILEAYLNEIYLGQRGTASINGVGEASRHYFAKDINQLTLSDCATLAGLIKNPYRYNPFVSRESARQRRDLVLKKLYEEEKITKEQLNEALIEPIITPALQTSVISAPYFVDMVKQELSENFPPDVLQSKGIKIFTTLDMTLQILAEEAIADGLKVIETAHAAKLAPDKKLETCLIAITPSTGYVRAMVGGREYSGSQFNRCTQAKRQTGSTFKPFVYLTAFDPQRSKTNFTPSSTVDDTSFTVKAGKKDWTPSNYDKQDHGTVTLRKALENSFNIATAKVAIDAGLENVVATAKDAGIKSPLLAVPSIALGSFEATPIEMAYAYAIFANQGVRVEPVTIQRLVTKEGQILERTRTQVQKVFDPKPVFLTTNILKGVLEHGTATAARAYGYLGIAAGKTGTTSSYRDSWFVGFTPKLLALSWVGYDDNTTTNLSGASGALPIWAMFMKNAEFQGTRDFTPPKGVIFVKVDEKSGKLTSKDCPEGVFEAFIEGTEPEESCTQQDIEKRSDQFWF